MSNLTNNAQQFSNACIDMNSISELQTALANDRDSTDIIEWNITESEYRAAITAAINEKLDD